MYNNVIYVLILIRVVAPCKHYNRGPLVKNQPHIAALILARGGSKSIPLKNLAKIHNKSLLNISLNTVSQVNFSSIWVSTDHHLIAEEAKFVNVHWRSPKSATDTAPSVIGVQDFVTNHPYVDYVALIQCTSPFIQSDHLRAALKLLITNGNCVFSVSRSFKLRWQQINHRLIPTNFSPKKRPRRQDWNGELVENGMFYFMSRKLVLEGYLQNERLVILFLNYLYCFALCIKK